MISITRTVLAGALAAGLGALGACMSPMASSEMEMDRMGASGSVMVGGAAMYPSRNIVENAVNSRDHTTLVAAVKAAGLVDTLSGPGPFTVFAPTNGAFERLPSGTVPTLLRPENKAMLTSVLTYHVVPGRLSAADLAARARAAGGVATLTTVQGNTLRVSGSGDAWVVTDAKGGRSRITIADVMQSNGVIHVVDTVLMPQ
jgi:uncharacterized surface protein with fasciclin (FAS1) repeats